MMVTLFLVGFILGLFIPIAWFFAGWLLEQETVEELQERVDEASNRMGLW